MNALTSCIHCGLCLEACPTYRVLGDEAESPRGRLRLMAELQQGRQLDFAPLDRCLGCRGCESVCPSGVPYGEHLEQARARRSPRRRWRWFVDRVLSEPALAGRATEAGMAARRLGAAHWLPQSLRAALDLLPARRPAARADLPAQGSVAILPGCMQSVLQPEVLRAVAELVQACGETPFVMPGTGCCGALSAHQGSLAMSKTRARQLLHVLQEVPLLLVPSAGCSAHLQNYAALLGGTELESAARELQRRSVDALPWLAARAEKLHFAPWQGRVAYHPPCHHSHAQGIRGQAERLLGRVPELELVRPIEAERCCGSAGSFSLEEPALASRVRAEKWADLRPLMATVVLSANPGCEFFLAAGRAPSDPDIDNLYCFLAARLGSGERND